MSVIVQPAVTVRENVLPALARPSRRAWIWFGSLVSLILFGHLLERFGAASIFGGYMFSLALLGIVMPQRLMEVFVFFLAVGHRDFTYTALKVGPAQLYITEWVLLILLLAALPSLPSAWRRYRPAMLALALYGGIGLVLFWLSGQYWGLGPRVRDFAVVYYTLFLVPALVFLRGAVDVNRLFVAMAAGTAFNILPDMLNYLYGTFPVNSDQKNYSMRSSYYYVVCAAYFLPGLLFQPRHPRWWTTAYVALVFFVVLFYVYSKTAMVALLFISVAGVLASAKRLRMGVLAAIIAIFMLALVITPAGKTFKFTSLFHLELVEGNSRSVLRNAALRDFSEYPYGIGFGAPIFGRHSREMMPDPEVFHAIHNSYLTILRRIGVEGFAAFSLLVALACRQVYRAWRLGADKGTLWPSSFAVLMSFAVAAIFAFAHVALEGPFLGSAFWVLLGAVFVVAREDEDRAFQKQQEKVCS